ncbi:MAG: hypothetical protein EOP81_04765 [Variovorax sp.]|nr:MAG: hypothetical protein EOP81_04765 [Variovorax sp.]
MDIGTSPEPDYAPSQREVQRWLGRCLLSLQQSERLLKALLHDSAMTAVHSGREGEGASAFEVRRPYDAERLRGMTLGGLVSAFFSDVVEETQAPRTERKEWGFSPHALSIQTRLALSLDAARRAGLEVSMRKQVALRNELVHHLSERFNLWSANGCADALEHLKTSYEQAESFRAELGSIGQMLLDVSQHAATIFQANPELLTAGRMNLANSSIVQALARCWQDCIPAGDGTVPLREIQALMCQRHPGETPEGYGRTSWPQLVHESGMFAIVRQDANGKRGLPRVRKVDADQIRVLR